MLKKDILILLTAFTSLPAFILPLPSTGDVFSSGSKPNFGQDASVCQDPQIQKIEIQSNTIARVFPLVSSGSDEGRFGRALEKNGYVYHTGVCKGNPNLVVMFIYIRNISTINTAHDKFVSTSQTSQQSNQSHRSDVCGWIRDMEKRGYCQITADNGGPSPAGITNAPVWLGEIPYDGYSGVSGKFAIRDGFPNSASSSKLGWIQMSNGVYIWGYFIFARDRHVYFNVAGASFESKNGTQSDGTEPDRKKIQLYSRIQQIPLAISQYGTQLYKSGKIDPARQKFLPNDL
jgi:hypothetical protein